MKHAVLGTGIVGTTIATRLIGLGHEVRLGARETGNDRARAWAKAAGARASHGTFADAAGFGELVWNCTLGAASLDALGAAGAANLRGKVLIDVANPLDFSQGMPPTLFAAAAGESLGERIQKAFPEARVVKALNTVNAGVMVDPQKVAGGDHDVFICGDDAQAKGRVTEILRGWFGWKRVIDLGGIGSARGTECYVAFWVRLWGAMGTADFNVKVVR